MFSNDSMPEMVAPINIAHSPQLPQPPTPTFNTSTLVALASMHVIDQSLREIAKDFRFTLEEVQEYYDKCGEMSRTRRRFQRMRDILTEKFADDNDE